MPMSGLTFPDHFARSHIKRRKERCSAIPFIVMGMALYLPGTQLQQGPCPAQRLNLTLLIYPQYQGRLRGIKVKPHNIDHFFL